MTQPCLPLKGAIPSFEEEENKQLKIPLVNCDVNNNVGPRVAVEQQQGYADKRFDAVLKCKKKDIFRYACSAIF